jgi:MraZ protein
MFRGQFLHSVDPKGRVSLPAKFREQLGETATVVLTPSPFDACLRLYPLPSWEELERKISALPSMDRHVTRFRRLFISGAQDVELDGSGRVRVAANLREHASLEKDVLWAGMGEHIELWSKPRWDQENEMSPEQWTEFRDKVEELIRV